jgi:D-alanyl-D-alanine carboxypeptidase/D-alanyl-D-alanine-endopeptidase (penicillin-binding protein 4)
MIGLRWLPVVLLLCAGPTLADDALPAPVRQALKAAAIPASAVAVVVAEADSGSRRLAHNADQAMNPASLMKLVTTFAALESLGPAYTWKTSAWTAAPLADGVLRGDLVLRGSGDPKFTLEQLWLLLRQLRGRGLRDIAGDLIIDRSLFAVGGDPGNFDDKPLRPYNVAPDALLLNFNSLRLTLVPDADGRRVEAILEPELANLDVVRQIRPAAAGALCGEWKDGLRAEYAQTGERWRLTVTGSYPLACGEKNWYLGGLPHNDYVAGVFGRLWQELGGTWQGRVRDGRLPAEARQLAQIESTTLAEQVRDINKYSNNVMARQLFLTLGAESGRQPARAEDGDAAVRAWLSGRELHLPDLVLDNGSGLSRRERLSAAGLARLLNAAWHSAVMPELVASLPLTGVDGTMKKRLKNNGVAGQAHIKTGTLDGVKAIAGFVRDRAGHNHTVVFLVNHANAQAAQAAQDALLDWVYAGAR